MKINNMLCDTNIDKIDRKELRGKHGEIVQNFISNRKQKCFTNTTESNTKIMTNSVSQGSVHAPVPYNLYVKDLENIGLHRRYLA